MNYATTKTPYVCEGGLTYMSFCRTLVCVVLYSTRYPIDARIVDIQLNYDACEIKT